MYQQSIARTLSTEEFFRSLNLLTEDDRKLSLRDILLMTFQVVATVAICWAVHTACA